MKPIDKKDQPKLFALIGMAVLAFGFGAYQFATSSTAQPTAPAPSPTPMATAANGNGEPGAEGDGTVWTPGGQLDVIPVSGRDPFMPEGMAAPQPAATPTPAPKPVTGTGGPISSPLPPTMGNGEGGGVKIPPPIPPMDLGPGGKTTVKVIQATPTPPPPAPTLDLSGVIVAEDNYRSKAIFKTADNKTNRILSIGDSAGNGWRIADIQEGKVEIIDPKTGRRATVELE